MSPLKIIRPGTPAADKVIQRAILRITPSQRIAVAEYFEALIAVKTELGDHNQDAFKAAVEERTTPEQRAAFEAYVRAMHAEDPHGDWRVS